MDDRPQRLSFHRRRSPRGRVYLLPAPMEGTSRCCRNSVESTTDRSMGDKSTDLLCRHRRSRTAWVSGSWRWSRTNTPRLDRSGQSGSSAAPTTKVPKLKATLAPKRSPLKESPGARRCCCVQVVPLLPNTYAEPASAPTAVSSSRAPTATTLLLTATDQPKRSNVAPSDAISFPCSVHSPPLNSKTYAAPYAGFPGVVVFSRAPPTSVLPSMATEKPKTSPLCRPEWSVSVAARTARRRPQTHKRRRRLLGMSTGTRPRPAYRR